MYTLITSVGTGMYDRRFNEETGYRKTTYIFPNRKEISSRLFFSSILESGNWAIDSVILVGTKTSSWDALIAKSSETKDEVGELWLSLIEQCDDEIGLGISLENVKLLESALTQQYGISFTIYVHDSTIDKHTLASVFDIYKEIPKSIPISNNVLLDITHGFRSMPLFLYQSMRLYGNKNIHDDMEIVYGEYIRDKGSAYVRNLSMFNDLTVVSEEIELFKEGFIGFPLANRIAKWWESGARWMRGFSNLVQSNYVLMIRESIRQLGNALKQQPNINEPVWTADVRGYCGELYERFNKALYLSDMIYILSKILFEKRLMTQCVIALQISVEARIIETFFEPSKIGDYTFYNEVGGPKEIKKEIQKEKRLYNLQKLEHLRNKIAHGGGDGVINKVPFEQQTPSSEEVKQYYLDVDILFNVYKGKI